MNKRGFTLIELLVVVAIIGILAAVGVVAYSGYTSGAKKQTMISNQKMIQRYALAEIYESEKTIELALRNLNFIPQNSFYLLAAKLRKLSIIK